MLREMPLRHPVKSHADQKRSANGFAWARVGASMGFHGQQVKITRKTVTFGPFSPHSDLPQSRRKPHYHPI
jgi:hypothetical protein